jgi:hypothetical protein
MVVIQHFLERARARESILRGFLEQIKKLFFMRDELEHAAGAFLLEQENC